MKKWFHFISALFVLCLIACTQTKNTKLQYTFIGSGEKSKTDTTYFDSLQISDPFILADETTRMYLSLIHI